MTKGILVVIITVALVWAFQITNNSFRIKDLEDKVRTLELEMRK